MTARSTAAGSGVSAKTIVRLTAICLNLLAVCLGSIAPHVPELLLILLCCWVATSIWLIIIFKRWWIAAVVYVLSTAFVLRMIIMYVLLAYACSRGDCV